MQQNRREKAGWAIKWLVKASSIPPCIIWPKSDSNMGLSSDGLCAVLLWSTKLLEEGVDSRLSPVSPISH